MKLKEKIKNKINNFKANTSRFDVLSLDEWLNSQGLQENAENRALYVQYKLDLDDKNKQQDKNLSKFIGSALFVVVFLVIFAIMCANSIGATGIVNANNQNYISFYNNNGFVSGSSVYMATIPRDFGDDTYYLITENYYLYGEMDDTNVLTIENVESFINDYSLYIDQNIYTTFVDWLVNNYDISLESVFYTSEMNTLIRGIYNQYNILYNLGKDDGYDEGYDVGKDDGYDVGYLEGTNEGETLKKGIFAIFDAPIRVITSLLDFEVLGVNFLTIARVIFTLILLALVGKWLIGAIF